MKPISRRRFLARTGASVAGAILAGSVAEKVLASMGTESGAVSGAAGGDAGSHAALTDLFSAVVADLEGKFPHASALYTSQSGVAITRDRNGKSVSESQNQTRGVSLRVFDGESFHEAAVGSDTPAAIHAAARALRSGVPLAKERFRIEPLPAREGTWKTQMTEDPAVLPLADRAAAVDAEFERANWDDPRVRNVTVNLDASRNVRVYVDRTRRLASETSLVACNLFYFGFDQGRPGFGMVRHTGQGGLEMARLTDKDVEKARKELVEAFGAEPIQAGEYDVVFAPEVSGLLAHESFGHGVEMDQFVKGRAKAQAFLGKPVASKIVNLLDDPSVPGARGSYPFDDEGMEAGPTTIIENGVFVRPLTDLMSATFLGTKRSPNGRAQGWDRKVYARMSNTFFANGTSDPAELLQSLSDGLYLEGFRNGIEDPQGWGIQFTVRMAREVKGGKPTGRVFAPISVTGYVPDILSNITMVANDLALEPGTCGKGFKEWVPVTSGGPHLRTRARLS